MIFIKPTQGMATVLDSADYPPDHYKDFLSILKNAWQFYAELGGQRPPNTNALDIKTYYACPKQPAGSVLCGYYVCEHLRTAGVYRVNREDHKKNLNEEWPVCRSIPDGGADRIASELCQFIRREILHKKGKFFDKNGSAADVPELCDYANINSF